MPTYEYRCTKCQESLEALQKMSDEPLKDCPKCQGKNTLKRGVGGGVGLSFKGDGFYITDYANPAAPKDKPKGQCCPCGKKESCSS